ncbi:alpha/beta hydrolase family protein [Nocardia sp. NPDC059228]|uniref:alpha/beta hydrolase family protein n=1 Tax=Nocardia sp. NPDC059228 TaxID=3346777 RepID=UPI0036B6C5A2
MFGRLAAVTAAMAVSVLQAGGAQAAPSPSMLPTPGGPMPVGTTTMHLVQHGRPDPFTPDSDRELMLSVFYPAADVTNLPRAHALSAVVLPALERQLGTPLPVLLSNSYQEAPVATGSYPVVLYSPGQSTPRLLGTGTAEELASRGYVVVTVDHTGDSPVVEFPGNRIVGAAAEFTAIPGGQRRDIQVADVEYVLDALTALHAGADPDAENRPLPTGLGAALDLTRVGAFGHSLGGTTAVEVAARDPRIDAVLDMDGAIPDSDDWGETGTDGVRQPLLVLRSAQTVDNGSGHEAFTVMLDHAQSWKTELELANSAHEDLTDLNQLIPSPMFMGGGAMVGPIAPARADAALRTTVTSFFDKFLRGNGSTALEHPETIPDITVMR